jgi:hypothetical protein
MLSRLTVSALLKAVILATSLWVVGSISLNCWDSWERLQAANRISKVANASDDLFKAMHSIRGDRSTTQRLLNSDQPIDSKTDSYLRGLRDEEMPAMASALEQLPGMEFPEQQALEPEFDRLYKLMSAEVKEF